jgi:hypothetical protein
VLTAHFIVTIQERKKGEKMKLLNREQTAEFLHCSVSAVDKKRREDGLPWNDVIDRTTDEALEEWVNKFMRTKYIFYEGKGKDKEVVYEGYELPWEE